MKRLLLLISLLFTIQASAAVSDTTLEWKEKTTHASTYPYQVEADYTDNGNGTITLSPGMVYPGAGIPISDGASWKTSITDNHSNWDTAYSWGNHASAGYLATGSDIDIGAYDFTTTGTGTFGDPTLATQGLILNDTSYVINAMGNLKINGSTYDSSDVQSIDTNNRWLYASDETTVLDWSSSSYIQLGAPIDVNGRLLMTNAGSQAVDIDNASLLDSNGVYAISWGARAAQDSSQNYAIDWGERKLYYTNGTTVAIDWDDQALLGDGNGNWGLDWHNRYLYASDGTTVILNWSTAGTADFGDNDITTTGTISAADVVASGYVYFGDKTTNGSWRIGISSGSLVVEKRESGSWVEKGAYEP